MKVIKEQHEFGQIITFEEQNKFLKIWFGGNGDLYWSLHSKSVKEENTFAITKENYTVYMLFEQLFRDIENINIFDEDHAELDTYEIEDKKKYRLFNYSNYNELYNDISKTITWYSDETSNMVANILKIQKREELFIIEFFIQSYTPGYDEDFHLLNYIPIRFRNSGSSYEPFNIVFMRMYRKMSELDDINDIGHQILIEEFLYDKKRLIKK